MTTERTAEEWGRVAVALPGWSWMARMYARVPLGPGATTWVTVTAVEGEWLHHSGDRRTLAHRCFPQVGDPATAGCLLALLGKDARWLRAQAGDGGHVEYRHYHLATWRPNLGRACIAAAEAIGRWPGGDL